VAVVTELSKANRKKSIRVVAIVTVNLSMLAVVADTVA